MKTKDYIKQIIIIAIVSLLAITFFKYKIGIPCIINKITGLYCPGCGATRAIYSLLELKFYQAFRYNILIVIFLPFGMAFLFYKYVLKGKKQIPNYIWFFIVIIVVLFGVLRNIPLFSYLAPVNS